MMTLASLEASARSVAPHTPPCHHPDCVATFGVEATTPERRRSVVGGATGYGMTPRGGGDHSTSAASPPVSQPDESTSGKSGDVQHGAQSPRRRRDRGRDSLPAPAGATPGGPHPRLFGRVEARSVAFVGMFFVTLTAASLYSLLAPFFPTVAGVCTD